MGGTRSGRRKSTVCIRRLITPMHLALLENLSFQNCFRVEILPLQDPFVSSASRDQIDLVHFVWHVDGLSDRCRHNPPNFVSLEKCQNRKNC